MTAEIRAVVEQYVALVGKGATDDIVALYAEDAVVEDPVGTAPHRGHEAIRQFYAAIEGLEKRTELITARISGNSAAFHFTVVTTVGDNQVELSPIDVMTFEDGKITDMKAYWSQEDFIFRTA